MHSFDDTIVIKGIDRYCDTDNKHILVENCVLWCDWGRACEIGLETSCNEYSDIVFRNCDIVRAGDFACDVQNGDWAEVHDVLFENINVEYNRFDTPSVMQTGENQKYDAKDKVAVPILFAVVNPRFRELYYDSLFKNLDEPMPVPTGTGYRQACCHDITLRNVNVYYDEDIPRTDGKYSVPILVREYVEGVHFYNLKVENVKINGRKLTGENAVFMYDAERLVEIK